MEKKPYRKNRLRCMEKLLPWSILRSRYLGMYIVFLIFACSCSRADQADLQMRKVMIRDSIRMRDMGKAQELRDSISKILPELDNRRDTFRISPQFVPSGID